MTAGRQPAVSVVIPVRNGLPDLLAQLDALDGQEGAPQFEVILADNGSTDGIAAVVRARKPITPTRLRLVDASGVRGVSHARNVGVAAAEAQKVLVCDADDVVSRQWVRAMSEALDRWDVVGGGLELDSLNPGPERNWRRPPAPGVLPIGWGYMRYAQGCNVGLRRDVWERIGGWDERLVDGGDDVDFSWRAQLAGFSLGASASALVSYRFRSEMIATAKQGFSYARSGSRLITKYAKSGLRPPGIGRLSARVARDLWRLPRRVWTRASRGGWLYAVAVHAGELWAVVDARRPLAISRND